MSELVTPDGLTEMELSLKYRGEPVVAGRMSARELGPALFGMAEVLERASTVVYGDRTALRVDVSGNFRRSSFAVNFVAVASPDSLVPGLSWADLAHIAAILGFGYLVTKDAAKGAVHTVLSLIRWQRGRKVEKVETATDDGFVRITLVGGEQNTVDMTIFNVWADKRVRKGLEDVTEPLKTPGMEKLEIGPTDQDAAVISPEEAGWFAAHLAPAVDEEPEVVTAYLEVVGPYFRTGKWRFATAGYSFHAGIEDEGFLEKVRRKVFRFGEGDVLKVRMRVQQEGSRAEPVRTILEVLDYIAAPSPPDQLEH